MHNRKMLLMTAAPICLALSSIAFAAPKPVKAVKPAAKPAVKASKSFDQRAVLAKFWKSPDSAVVATVNGASITKGELMKALWNRTAPDVLSQLMDQKLVEQAAAKAKVKVTDAEFKAKVDEALKQTGLKSLDQLLSQYKVTYERATTGIRLQALVTKMVETQAAVTDAELGSYVKVRHILIAFPADAKDQTEREATAKTKADEVLAKLKAGGNFAELAKQYSEDPGSKDKGGEYDWFTRGRMAPEFETASFALQPGQISEPVKTTYGYHIIQSIGLGSKATAAQKAELKKTILASKVPMMMGPWFNGIKASAKIDNKLQGPQPQAQQPPMAGPRPNAPRVTPTTSTPRPVPQPSVQPAPQPQPEPSDRPDTPPAPPAD